MLPDISKVKGVHPGAIIKRELKSKGIKAKDLAQTVNEYPQTISAILKGRRGITPKLSIALGNYFEVSPEYFMILQACSDIRKIQSKRIENSSIKNFNPALFWDVSIEKLDKCSHKRFIIQRIAERGKAEDIEYLQTIYTKEEIKEVLSSLPRSFLSTFQKKVNDVLISIESRNEVV